MRGADLRPGGDAADFAQYVATLAADLARLAREHNDANVLALGARLTSPELAWQIVEVFLDTPFAGGRHQRRLEKITAIEHGRSAR